MKDFYNHLSKSKTGNLYLDNTSDGDIFEIYGEEIGLAKYEVVGSKPTLLNSIVKSGSDYWSSYSAMDSNSLIENPDNSNQFSKMNIKNGISYTESESGPSFKGITILSLPNILDDNFYLNSNITKTSLKQFKTSSNIKIENVEVSSQNEEVIGTVETESSPNEVVTKSIQSETLKTGYSSLFNLFKDKTEKSEASINFLTNEVALTYSGNKYNLKMKSSSLKEGHTLGNGFCFFDSIVEKTIICETDDPNEVGFKYLEASNPENPYGEPIVKFYCSSLEEVR